LLNSTNVQNVITEYVDENVVPQIHASVRRAINAVRRITGIGGGAIHDDPNVNDHHRDDADDNENRSRFVPSPNTLAAIAFAGFTIASAAVMFKWLRS
jgi:hypothetical protein